MFFHCCDRENNVYCQVYIKLGIKTFRTRWFGNGTEYYRPRELWLTPTESLFSEETLRIWGKQLRYYEVIKLTLQVIWFTLTRTRFRAPLTFRFQNFLTFVIFSSIFELTMINGIPGTIRGVLLREESRGKVIKRTCLWSWLLDEFE